MKFKEKSYRDLMCWNSQIFVNSNSVQKVRIYMYVVCIRRLCAKLLYCHILRQSFQKLNPKSRTDLFIAFQLNT